MSLYYSFLLPLLFLFFFKFFFLIFAQDSVCSDEESSFGPCLPGNPKTCPVTCPTGCHCEENVCCYPKSAVQNSFWNRINGGVNSPQQQQQNYNMGDQLQQQINNNNGQQINNYLLMLLLLKQQQQMFSGSGGSGFWGCQDQASNCASMTPLCLFSTKMLSFCPSSCGICPLYNPQFVRQRLLQILLGSGGGGSGGNMGSNGNNNIGGGYFPFGGGGGQGQIQQQSSSSSQNTLGKIQGFLDQAQGVANSANTALGAFGGPGLNLQTIGQAFGQRFGFG